MRLWAGSSLTSVMVLSVSNWRMVSTALVAAGPPPTITWCLAMIGTYL